MGNPSISARRPYAALEVIWNGIADRLPQRNPLGLRPSLNLISESEKNSTLHDRSQRAATIIENLTNNPNDLTLDAVQYLFEDFFSVRKNKNGDLELKVNDKSQILLHENRDAVLKNLAELAKHSLTQNPQELVSSANGDQERNEMSFQILDAFVEYSKGNMNWFHLNRHVKPFGLGYRDYIDIPVIDIIGSEQNSAKHFQAVAALTEVMNPSDQGFFDKLNFRADKAIFTRFDFNKSLDFKLNGIERTYNQNAYNHKLFPYKHVNQLGTQIKDQLLKSLQDLCLDRDFRLQREREDTASTDKIYQAIGWGLTNFIPHNEYGDFAQAAVALIQTSSTDEVNFTERHKKVVEIIHNNAGEIHQLEKKYQKAQNAQSADPQNASLLKASQEAEEALRKKTQEVEATYQFFGQALEKFKDLDVKSLFLSKLLGENDKDHNGLAKLICLDPQALAEEQKEFIDMKKTLAEQTLEKARDKYESFTNTVTDADYKSLIDSVMDIDSLGAKYPDSDLDSYDKSSIYTLIEEKKMQKAELQTLSSSKVGDPLVLDLSSQDSIKANIISLERELKTSTDSAVQKGNLKLIDLLDSYRDFHQIAKLDAKIDGDTFNLNLVDSYTNRQVGIEAARNEYNQAKEDLANFKSQKYLDELKAEFIDDRTQSMEHESYRFISSMNPGSKQMNEICDNLLSISEMYANKHESSIDFDLITEKLSMYFKRLLQVFEMFMNGNQNEHQEAVVT